MRCRTPRDKFFSVKVLLLLTLLLSTFSLRSSAQEDKRDSQTPTDDSRTDSKAPADISGKPGLILAFEGGSGLASSPRTAPTGYAGFKFGGSGIAIDVGYDHIPSRDGVSLEFSGMLPVIRFPGPQKDRAKNYLRVFAEPGLGFRAGGGATGYASAKVMMVLFSDNRLLFNSAWWSPFIEAQRRFPFGSPLRGDNRVAFGLMFAICEHCGPD